MRQIGTLNSENYARSFVNYLAMQNIACTCEVVFEPQNGHMSYQIWIQDEDKIERASAIFSEFEKNPTDAKFKLPEPEPEPIPINEEEAKPQRSHKFNAYLTYFFIALCSLIYVLGLIQRIQLANASPTFTPIQSTLMYDEPPSITSPFWKGFYGLTVAKLKGKSLEGAEGPLFEDIRNGEVWRLFTPCILHVDLLHLLFNMLWLWYLGRPVEQRIGPFRLLLFILITGILSNTAQYLMSGPLFIGYSGIVTALAAFIWMRQKVASWEGYPLSRATALFLLFFILAIFGIQVISFFIEVYTTYKFTPNIANTAHISGMIMGAIFARFRFFAQRIKR